MNTLTGNVTVGSTIRKLHALNVWNLPLAGADLRAITRDCKNEVRPALGLVLDWNQVVARFPEMARPAVTENGCRNSSGTHFHKGRGYSDFPS